MRGVYAWVGFAVVLLLSAPSALAQDVPAPPVKPNPVPSAVTSPKLTDFFSAKTPYEFWLTCIILVAGLIFAYLAVSFLRQIHRQELENATRAMTILFVIMATMVLITAGYNNEQIAPAFGLFGTIVGYILGKGSEKRSEPETDNAPQTNGERRGPAEPAKPATGSTAPTPAREPARGASGKTTKPGE
jgi:hypothetical protein